MSDLRQEAVKAKVVASTALSYENPVERAEALQDALHDLADAAADSARDGRRFGVTINVLAVIGACWLLLQIAGSLKLLHVVNYAGVEPIACVVSESASELPTK